MDLVTPAYRAASLVAQTPARRHRRRGRPPGWPRCWRRGGERAAHDGRAPPAPGRPATCAGAALRRRVQHVFASYARYYGESFRLPGHRPRRARRPPDLRGLRARRRGPRQGPRPAACACRTSAAGSGRLLADPGPRAPGHRGGRAHRAARSCSTGSSSSASASACTSCRSGPRPAGRRWRRSRPATSSPCCATATSAGGGVEVDVLRRAHDAARPGPPPSRSAPGRRCCPTAVYFEGRDHHGVIRPPLAGRAAGHAPRRRRPHHPGPGRRARGPDPPGARAVAPDAAELAERPRRLGSRSGCERAPRGRSGRAQYPDAVRIGLVCPYSLTVPGGVQAPGAGPRPHAARRSATTPGCSAPCDGPPPDAGVTPLGQSVPDGLERLGRPAGARPAGPAPHDPGAARRGVRRPPPARAARARADA